MTADDLPPEVYGCLSIAQRHLHASRRGAGKYYRWKDRKKRHDEKVQRLVEKAARHLRNRGT